MAMNKHQNREQIIRDNSNRFFMLTDVVENPFMNLDLLRMLCGDHLGSGAYRMVFDFDLISGMVIKIAYGTAVTANQMEFEVWQAVKDTPTISRWFAPCFHLSPCGHFLLQKKCRPINNDDKLPKKVPNNFTDLKKENFGFIGKRLVCHDYQFISRSIDAAFYSSMRETNWE